MSVPLADFSEGPRMVAMLAGARREGTDFDQAWAAAMLRIRRGRSADNERWTLAKNAFNHHKDAWRRAYLREPPTSLDAVGSLLLLVMQEMYDDSEFVEPEWVYLPEAA